jgi:hypothetical protein
MKGMGADRMSLRGESNDRREFDSTKQSLSFSGEIASSRSTPFGRRTLLAMTSGEKRVASYLLLITSYLLLSSVAQAFTTDTTDIMDTSTLKRTLTMEEWAAESSSHDCQLSGLANLNFGGIYCSSTSGTVTVSPASLASYAGGVMAHTGVQNYTVAAAEVQLNLTNTDHCNTDDHCQNDNNEYCRNEDDDDRTNDTRTSFQRHGCSVSITISSSSVMTRTGGDCTGNGPYTMTVDNYTFTRTEGYIYIGGKMHVNANQCPGNYSGTFTVSTNCQ